jgi:hypothetical protein
MSEVLTDKGKSTQYVVLRRSEPGEPHVVWEEAGRASAASAKAAISQVVGETAGTYVAVPARSFQPVEVTVEQKATLKFGGAS